MTRDELAAALARRVGRDPLARSIRDLARTSGASAWFVGGFVRDAALGRRARDLDLSAGAGAERLLRLIEDRSGHRPFRFRKRGVTTWRFVVDSRQIDIVDARRRGIEQDLWRRELTINAIGYDAASMRLLDPTRGLTDLRRRRLRLPRDGAIADDPLRALRIARFLAELPDFTLHSQARIEATRAAPSLRRVAAERMRDELDKLLSSTAPDRGLDALERLGLLRPLLPELEPVLRCRAGADRPDVWSHTVDAVAISARPARLPGSSVCREQESRRLLRWALLLHDISKPETLTVAADGTPSFHGHEVLGAKRAETLLRRLRMARADRRRIGRLILLHLRPGHLADAGAPPRGLRRLVRDAGPDLPLLVLHAACDARASGGPDDPVRWRRLRRVLLGLQEMERRRSRLTLPRLIDGHGLVQALEIEPGPLVGHLLRAIREAQEEGHVATREEALVLARKLRAKEAARTSRNSVVKTSGPRAAGRTR